MNNVNNNNITTQKKNNYGFFATAMFLVSPILTVYFAFKNKNEKWSKNILWFFAIFFGYTLILTSEGIDGYVYWQDLVIMHQRNTNFNYLKDSIFNSGESVDFIAPILTYIVSLFTNSAKVLFAVFGLIFGYFYSRLIWYLIKNESERLSFNKILLLTCFALTNPLWNINGFRFWTASIIFVYGVCFYLLNGQKKKKLFIIILTPLIHFSFSAAVLIFILYIFIGNRTFIYFALFFSTIYYSILNFEFLQNISYVYLPEAYNNRVIGYTNEAYGEQVDLRKLSINWYVSIHNIVIIWFTRISLLLLFLFRKSIIANNSKFENLFAFTLLFYSYANVMSNIPSGARFLTIAIMLTFFILIRYYQYFNIGMKKFIVLGTPILIMFIIVRLRMGFDFINITAIFGNPMIAFFYENTMPLIDLIK
ncbi:hypothetical protein [Namhaeicola litoreus]|uniref:EpsG family protein n=1 Tax=Namhaeicola litoreus TaxID=1052145 RepID=A0ABW3Y2N2_9FLAO